MGAAFLFARSVYSPSLPAPSSPSRKTEWILFLSIMGLAAIFRIYRLDSMPPGLFADQGYEGWTALRILHEGFRPVWEADYFQNPALLLYQLAGWFFFVPSGRFTFLLFFAFISLATLPLVYWTFRELAGPRTALLGLFFLAVMRWNVNFSRNGFPTIQVPFYIFGTLAFLLWGLRTGKRWAFMLSALFFGLGFYTYQAYKAFPLWLILLGIFALFHNRQALRPHRKYLSVFLSLSLLLALPFILHNLRQPGLGNREDSISILTQVVGEGNLSPLLDNIKKTALMFNWQGDPLSRHNLPGLRMLDDGMGILFIFGFFLALVTFWKKISYFALTGFFVLCLPGVLSINSAHANRLLALTPLVALLAALPLSALMKKAESSGRLSLRMLTLLLLALALPWIARQNFETYFFSQASDADAFEQYDSEETFVGQKSAQYGGSYELYFAPYYTPVYTLRFLGYSHRDHVHLLNVPEDLSCPANPQGLGRCFFLESDRDGLYDLLKSLYPGGRTENFYKPTGDIAMRLYLVPPAEFVKKKGISPAQLVPRGLKGFYYGNPKNPWVPTLIHRDPLINFSNKGTFPLNAPLIRWKGILEVPRAGIYDFSTRSWCDVSLTLDGIERIPAGETEGNCFLRSGAHKIEVIFQNPDEKYSWGLNLCWRKPGSDKSEIIPNQAFGILR